MCLSALCIGAISFLKSPEPDDEADILGRCSGHSKTVQQVVLVRAKGEEARQA
jgi:hypothetical protein